MNRRAFLAFLGATALASVGRPQPASAAFDAFAPIAPSRDDVLVVPEGFRADPIVLWGDRLRGGDRVGYNADFTAFFPLPAEDALLWVNHEFVSLATAGFAGAWEQSFPLVMGRTPAIEDAKRDVGGSVVHVRRVNGRWHVVPDSRYHRRITAAATERIVADGPAVADVFERYDVDGLGRTVQGTHPGDRWGVRGAGDVTAPRGSNWPAGTPGAPPRPGVVAITRR
ncbi:MAG: DUF839 domain-containing protein [Candidatus Rokubacteria bacterium]|nr:DUF839 domain-containing protein [Candidatus Rokubacteria bacterium]